MRRLILLLALSVPSFAYGAVHQGPNKGVFASSGGSTTFALVQSSCTNWSRNSPLGLKLPGSVATGDLLVFYLIDTGNTLGSGQVVDNKGNTFSMRPEGGAGDGSSRVGIFISTNATGGSVYAATATIGGATFSGCIAEFSGPTLFDQSNTATGTSASPNSGNITTTVQALWLGVMTHDSGSGTTITPNATWTQIGEIEENSTSQDFNAMYKIQNAATDSAGWTIASNAWKTNVTTVK